MTGLLGVGIVDVRIVDGADDEAGGWEREGFGGVWHFVPFLEFVAEGEFGFDAGDGIEHDAADASEGVGVVDGNTAHGVVDVSGGHEIAGNGLQDRSLNARFR
jgi:hypothetical protein